MSASVGELRRAASSVWRTGALACPWARRLRRRERRAAPSRSRRRRFQLVRSGRSARRAARAARSSTSAPRPRAPRSRSASDSPLPAPRAGSARAGGRRRPSGRTRSRRGQRTATRALAISCGLQRIEPALRPLGVLALRELGDHALVVEPRLGLPAQSRRATCRGRRRRRRGRCSSDTARRCRSGAAPPRCSSCRFM